jgi:hypothetical protein
MAEAIFTDFPYSFGDRIEFEIAASPLSFYDVFTAYTGTVISVTLLFEFESGFIAPVCGTERYLHRCVV